ncbi:hypothetical protein GCM10011316_15180 [Roseibium aquae]|uniref:Uncharacterized protein n=1 Tax=Roseibium aquae TaxID=1323746 RepID=A0A916THD0_9HYPH|nr:hypothetical protein [Roseibium aquae]GGB44141.1 hypothetical protein GCM10011316_15180 [Roseibium aquae]
MDHILNHFESYAALYVLLQSIALWVTQGWWRVLAMVPLVPVLAVVGLVIAASGSGGNVTPILLFFVLPPALIFIVLLLLLYGLLRWRGFAD